MWKLTISITFLLPIIVYNHSACIHHQISKNATKHFFNDLTDKRLLAAQIVGKIRIFADYSQVSVGSEVQINTIKRVTNITANYFYNILNVSRLSRLYFPANTSLTCNTLKVSDKYVTQGVIGDLGVLVGSQANDGAVYVAKSLSCVFMESNKRPIWGALIWNNVFLKYDQVGFQQMIYIANHEMTHILGFSAMMYEMYPKGNPLVTGPLGDYQLNSTLIQQEIKKHYGCNSSLGLPLQDQDGTLIASHWERKVVGNQYMIASGKKGAYLSRFTLALLDSSGWYPNVNYTYAEPTTWGKGKGCKFLNIDDCGGNQFCQDTSFNCDWQGTAIGKCGADPFSGSCTLFKYFTNTICTDQNYELKNLNAKLNALQRGGSSSRCFNSDFRQQGLQKSKLDQRCYVSVCSSTGAFIYIMVGSSVMVCRSPGQVIIAPPGLNGSLTCPKSFDNICKNKKTCPYHCNKNGACVDGKCICTASIELSSSCVDVSIFLAPVGLTGGLLNSLNDNNNNGLVIKNGVLVQNNTNPNSNSNGQFRVRQYIEYSINSKCIQGTVFDKIFGQCLKCKDIYNCQNCTPDGCLVCDNGNRPSSNGRC